MRKRRWGRRLLGVLALLVLLELALQAAGPLVQRAMSRREADTSPDSPLAILCVGDSNTYGLHVPRIYAYPALLKTRLESRYRAPVAVANRGVPGHNTAQVATALPGDIADVKPDLVLILAGINDTWNTGAEQRGALGFVEQFKLLRLLRVLLAGVTSTGRFEIRSDEQGEILVDRGSGAQRVNAEASGTAPRTGQALAARVRAGLIAGVGLCAEHGATPVLMTYAESQGDFAQVNAAIRELAAERGLLLADHAQAFAERIADEGYEALMLNDHHPNVRGYQLMAETVDAALCGAGWVPSPGEVDVDHENRPGAGRPPPMEPLTGADAPRLQLLQDGRLELSGRAGVAFQLLCSRRGNGTEGISIGQLHIPLYEDEVFNLSRLEPTFSGQLDERGRAVLAVPAAVQAAAGAAGLQACLILLRQPGADTAGDESPVLAVSDLLAIDA